MRIKATTETLRVRTRATVAALRGYTDYRKAATKTLAAVAARAAVLSPNELAALRDVEDFANMRRALGFSLAPDDNCIDVGAHRGAVLAEMLRVAPRGHHIAFEPLPHLSRMLRDTFPQVQVRESALSNQPGEADFAFVHGTAEGWSGLLYRPLPTGEEPVVEQIKVRLEVMDEVLDPEYRPALIKIDVEGAEQQVLEGCLQTLRRHRPVVIFEHGAGSAEAYGTSPADVYRLLSEEAAMRIFDLDGSGPYQLAEFERIFFAGERVNFVAHT
jgi:FkbM family methyltransferase